MKPTSSGVVQSQDPSRSDVENPTKIDVTYDTVTFDDLQTSRLREMERRIEAETKRKRRNWRKEIQRMREEILEMTPVNDAVDHVKDDTQNGVTTTMSSRLSDDVVDPTSMKTTFLDYPDTGRRFKVRFNLTGFIRKSIAVTTDGAIIEVRASRISDFSGGMSVGRECVRRVEKPLGVDHAKLKSYLTSDDVLIVEAPVAPTSLDLTHVVRRSTSTGSGHLQSSGHSSSPSNHNGSPGTPGSAPSKEKYGVPIFREEDGRRRMQLVVDIGTAFQPNDILVQVIKENKILVKAKREDMSEDRKSKNKFSKEYELTEKIETRSLRGGLQNDGKLIVTAFAKGPKNTSCLRRRNSSAEPGDSAKTGSRKTDLEKTGSDRCDARTAAASDRQESTEASSVLGV